VHSMVSAAKQQSNCEHDCCASEDTSTTWQQVKEAVLFEASVLTNAPVTTEERHRAFQDATRSVCPSFEDCALECVEDNECVCSAVATRTPEYLFMLAHVAASESSSVVFSEDFSKEPHADETTPSTAAATRSSTASPSPSESPSHSASAEDEPKLSRRIRNRQAVQRHRAKLRNMSSVLQAQVDALKAENAQLRRENDSLRRRLNISGLCVV